MIKFTLYPKDPIGVLKRDYNRAKREVFELLGKTWHRQMRPKHFTHRGAREYGYVLRGGQSAHGATPRKGSYTYRKRRDFKHTLPLVFTGQSRMFTRTRASIRTMRQGFRVVMRAPGLNRRPKGGRIRMHEELTKMTRKERDELVREFGKRIETRLVRMRPKDRRRSR